MDSIRELQAKIVAFRDERDWAKFHNAKDLAIDLSVEASELLELFLWKQPQAVSRERIEEELADVLYAALLIAHDQEMDVTDIVSRKLKKNAEKYPIELSRGNAKKYNELGS